MLSSRTAGKGRQGVGVPVVLSPEKGPTKTSEPGRAAATAGRPPSRRQEEETEREGGGSAHTGRGREREREAGLLSLQATGKTGVGP